MEKYLSDGVNQYRLFMLILLSHDQLDISQQQFTLILIEMPNTTVRRKKWANVLLQFVDFGRKIFGFIFFTFPLFYVKSDLLIPNPQLFFTIRAFFLYFSYSIILTFFNNFFPFSDVIMKPQRVLDRANLNNISDPIKIVSIQTPRAQVHQKQYNTNDVMNY